MAAVTPTTIATRRASECLAGWAVEDLSYLLRGRRQVAVTPCPCPSLDIVMVPPCASTMARVIANPKPVPVIPRRRGTAVLFVLTKTLYSIVALSCHAETRIKEQIRDASTAVSFAGIGG